MTRLSLYYARFSNIAAGTTLDARMGGASGNSTGTFSNLDGTTGTLGGGGTFNVGGSFLFDPSRGARGGNIYAIGTGTTLILNGSSAQVLYGPGSGTDALANLNEVTGTLTVENGAGRTFTPKGGTFTIDSTGTMNFSAASDTLSVAGALLNNGTVNDSGTSGNLTVTGTLTNNHIFNVTAITTTL